MHSGNYISMQETTSDIDEPGLSYCNESAAGNETGHVGNVTRYFMFRRSPAPAEHI